jgi:hypothetical protein
MMIISWKGREKIFLSVTAVIILCILAGYAGKEADPNPANSSTMPVQEVGNIESDQIISEQEGFDFFAEYRMERERMRSREVETLKEVINKEDCSQDAKDAAALRLVKISENVEKDATPSTSAAAIPATVETTSSAILMVPISVFISGFCASTSNTSYLYLSSILPEIAGDYQL